MYKVEPSERAYMAIAEIDEYMSTFADADTVVKVIRRIQQAIIELADMPSRHRRYLPLISGKPTIRYAHAGAFLVYFTIEEETKTVSILDVQHARRDPASVRDRLQ